MSEKFPVYNTWTLERLKGARINVREGHYKAIPEDDRARAFEQIDPSLFDFRAISIGDGGGQAFIVPLDESSRIAADLILAAIKAHMPSTEKEET